MRRLGLAYALLLALGGCNPFQIPDLTVPADMSDVLDECTNAPASRSCFTVHLRGAVGLIDTVQIDSTFELAGQQVTRRIVSRNPGGGVNPPIAVGVILTQNAGDSISIKVLARVGASPVALGQTYLSGLRPGQHGVVAVNLIPAAQSRCFDGIKDGDESDVDCGWIGECPICTVGNLCVVSQDCADSTCADSGNGTYRCR